MSTDLKYVALWNLMGVVIVGFVVLWCSIRDKEWIPLDTLPMLVFVVPLWPIVLWGVIRNNLYRNEQSQ